MIIYSGDSPEVDILAIGNAPLDTPTPIRQSPKRPAGLLHERVIMPASWDLGSPEPGADLESFSGRDGEHSVCELSFHLIEDRLTEACGDITDHACDCSSDGVLSVFCTDDTLRVARLAHDDLGSQLGTDLCHPFGGLRMRTPCWVSIDLFPCHGP